MGGQRGFDASPRIHQLMNQEILAFIAERGIGRAPQPAIHHHVAVIGREQGVRGHVVVWACAVPDQNRARQRQIVRIEPLLVPKRDFPRLGLSLSFDLEALITSLRFLSIHID